MPVSQRRYNFGLRFGQAQPLSVEKPPQLPKRSLTSSLNPLSWRPSTKVGGVFLSTVTALFVGLVSLFQGSTQPLASAPLFGLEWYKSLSQQDKTTKQAELKKGINDLIEEHKISDEEVTEFKTALKKRIDTNKKDSDKALFKSEKLQTLLRFMKEQSGSEKQWHKAVDTVTKPKRFKNMLTSSWNPLRWKRKSDSKFLNSLMSSAIMIPALAVIWPSFFITSWLPMMPLFSAAVGYLFTAKGDQKAKQAQFEEFKQHFEETLTKNKVSLKDVAHFIEAIEKQAKGKRVDLNSDAFKGPKQQAIVQFIKKLEEPYPTQWKKAVEKAFDKGDGFSEEFVNFLWQTDITMKDAKNFIDSLDIQIKKKQKIPKSTMFKGERQQAIYEYMKVRGGNLAFWKKQIEATLQFPLYNKLGDFAQREKISRDVLRQLIKAIDTYETQPKGQKKGLLETLPDEFSKHHRPFLQLYFFLKRECKEPTSYLASMETIYNAVDNIG